MTIRADHLRVRRLASLLLPGLLLTAGCGVGVASDADEATCASASDVLPPIRDAYTQVVPDLTGLLQASDEVAATWYPDDSELAGGAYGLRRALADAIEADDMRLSLDSRVQLGNGMAAIESRCDDYGLGW